MKKIKKNVKRMKRMGKNEKRVSLTKIKKSFNLIWRATGLVWKVSKGYFVCHMMGELMFWCAGYWEIYFTARLLDEILTDRSPERLIFFVACLLGGTLLLRCSASFVFDMLEIKGFEFNSKEQLLMAKKVGEMDYALLEDESVNRLYKQVVRETYNDGKNLVSLRHSIPGLITDTISSIIALTLIRDSLKSMTGSGRGLIALFIVALAGLWIASRNSMKITARYSRMQNEISESCLHRDGYCDYLAEYEKGKEIRIFGIGPLIVDRLMSAHHFNNRALEKWRYGNIPYQLAEGFATEGTNTVVRVFFVTAALAGKISLGGMTQCMESFFKLMTAVKYVFSGLADIWVNADYLERYFAFMDMPSQMRKGNIPVEKRMDMDYSIVFEHVSFRYPGSETYALQDINLEFKAGEKLAVVGMNGSGKSTFIKLLCRLYDPTEGRILMNGIDIRRYQYEEYLQLFSVVFQDFKLFSFSLGENVAVEESYLDEKVESALNKAGLEGFLAEHPKGLQSVLYRDFDADGLEISGGEAQKIALARAVCKGAPFVLLDEPTAALDPLAEYEIYKRFNDLVADRTTVYISHRMSSCRFCGDIAVFHEGRLIQRGSHDTLMKQTDGKYYELWQSQAQYYQESG